MRRSTGRPTSFGSRSVDFRRSMVPAQFVEATEPELPVDDALPGKPNTPVEQVLMEQRVTEIDDVPDAPADGDDSGEESAVVGVSIANAGRADRHRPARTTITCLAAPTTEPGLVKGMLKGLILLSLQTLKQRLENS